MPRITRKSKILDPILTRLLRVADHAYHEGESDLLDDFASRGDGLADFIRQEIIETFENIEPGPEGVTERQAAGDAVQALYKAERELGAVAAALGLLVRPRWWRCRDCGSLRVQGEAWGALNAPGDWEFTESRDHYCADCEEGDRRVCEVDAENNCHMHNWPGGESNPQPFTKCREMTDDEIRERCKNNHDDPTPCPKCLDLIALKIPEVPA